MAAVFHEPGEGEVHRFGPSTLAIKATGAETADSLFVAETTIAPGFPGPPLHVHERLHDMFYVLEGELAVRIGDDERTAPAGTFVCIPPGTPHTFSNPGDAPARFLNFNTPAGWENYMRDLAAAFASGEPVTPEAIGQIASRYDFRAV